MMNPLLISSTELIDKLRARGYNIDKKLQTELHNKSCAYEPDEGSIETFWAQQDLSVDLNLQKEEANLLQSLLVTLSTMQNVNYVNYCVFLLCITDQEIKNVYKFLFVEWKKMETSLPTRRLSECFRRTPREILRLDHTGVRRFWIEFIQSIFMDPREEKLSIYFFLNRLYQYFIPFDN